MQYFHDLPLFDPSQHDLPNLVLEPSAGRLSLSAAGMRNETIQLSRSAKSHKAQTVSLSSRFFRGFSLPTLLGMIWLIRHGLAGVSTPIPLFWIASV